MRLESNMTAKDLPLDPVSMGIDRFGFEFGSVRTMGCSPVIPREGGIVLSCTDTPKMSIKWI